MMHFVEGRLLFLGTGGSAGVPMMGCPCAVCHSADGKNQRLRSAALLKVGGKQLLIDAGPDVRAQALRYGIPHLDGVLLTHTHFDHVAGLDELRAYYVLHRHVLPVLVSQPTLQTLKRRYDYLFCEPEEGVSLTAQLDFHLLHGDEGEVEFCTLPITYMTYYQGGISVNGFRIGSLAYLTDIKQFSPHILHYLKDVKTLIISALRENSSYMHLTIAEAIALARQVGATQTYFTHIGHEVEHEAVSARLPSDIALAYDGLEVSFSLPTQ